MRERVTYADIAAHADVSTATVSRVLAGKPGVRAEVVDRVRESASALGYRTNRAARALRRQQSDAIGLVVSDIENPFFASIARVVEEQALQHGDAVLLCTTDESVENERRHLNLMMGESVEGVIAVPTLEDPGPLLELHEAGIPIVLIDRDVEGGLFDSVMVDHAAGARALVEHLIEHGHRHIALITVRTVATASSERLAGAQAAVDAHPGTRLTVLDSSAVGERALMRNWGVGERLMQQVLELPDVPTAVFCTNNLLSLGALRGARNAGVRVPEDMALVGFDDELAFELLDPPLTVAAQPIEQIGRTATELLYRRIAEPAREPQAVVLPAEFRRRASCGCAAGSDGVPRPEHNPNKESK